MATISSKSKKIRKIVKEYIKTLKPFIQIEKAILFGSWARGRGHRDSDIDLIVISPDFGKLDFMKRLIWLSKMRREKFMSPPMDIFGYTSEEFEKLSKESIVLEEAKKEGVVIK